MEDLKVWLEVHVTCSSVIPSHGRLEFNMCRQHTLFNLKKIYIRSNFYKGANASGMPPRLSRNKVNSSCELSLDRP